MLFWLLAIAITAIACAALYYAAAGRVVNAPRPAVEPAVEANYRRQLAEIAGDIAAGRMAEPEGEAARRELAREYVRQAGEVRTGGRDYSWLMLPVSLGMVVIVAFATYGALGRPDLPAQPLASRADVAAQSMSLEAAVAEIEGRLATNPDDLRGWTVIGPAYIELGRYVDAERAYRRVLALAPPTADAETDLAEVLLAQNGGMIIGEPLALLQSALARDPRHVRSRFYLAGEATRAGDFAAARDQWTAVLDLAKGDEPWIAKAQEGLTVAEAGLRDAAIRGMVEGLNSRLLSNGGTIAEWTELVRSRLVLGEREAAQSAYDLAVKAYPDPAVRAELDALAREQSLEVAS